MPDLCDVSFLLPLCHGRHEHHGTAREHLESISVAGDLVVCRASQLSLLRLLSNPVLMHAGVCTTDQAWRVYDFMVADDRFAFQTEPYGVESALREMTRGFPFSPKLWQDAYLAAFARAAGLRVVTFDGGFRKFDGLDHLILTPKNPIS